MLTELEVSFGWRKNKMLMNEITMFLFRLGTHFDLMKYRPTQIKLISTNNMMGSIPTKNNLKNELDGKGP